MAGEAPSAQADFTRDIRPILLKNCVPCHGRDAEARQANLRLDVREGAVADRGGYQAIVPGSPESSRAFQRITHEAETARMPPPATGKTLTHEEIQLIRNWIEQGANYDEHWSFTPPIRHPLPLVRNSSWPKNEIDYFVLARLEEEGLSPSPEADPHTLIRRLYLDLIGLPPTPAQVVAFVEDKEPGAYEHLIDELLNSPRYGERWARVWLDLARYADSQGYESDTLRSIWPYRDWVIRALNDNMSYDRFTLEQIAGDLLPVPTKNQLIATGFSSQHTHQQRGGHGRRRIPGARRQRSRQHDDAGMDGPDRRLCAMPRPQVRPDYPEKSFTSSMRSSIRALTATSEMIVPAWMWEVQRRLLCGSCQRRNGVQLMSMRGAISCKPVNGWSRTCRKRFILFRRGWSGLGWA